MRMWWAGEGWVQEPMNTDGDQRRTLGVLTLTLLLFPLRQGPLLKLGIGWQPQITLSPSSTALELEVYVVMIAFFFF